MKFKTFDGRAPAGMRKNVESFEQVFTKNENLILENCKALAAILQKLEGLDLSMLLQRREEVDLLEKTKIELESARYALFKNFEIANFYENEWRDYPRNIEIATTYDNFSKRIKTLFDVYCAVASELLQFENTRLLTSVAYARHLRCETAWGYISNAKSELGWG